MSWLFIEECKDLNVSQFYLVVLAVQRAYDLKSGSTPEIQREENSKSAVVALEEITKGKLDIEQLRRLIIKRISNAAGSGYSWVSSNNAQASKSFEVPEIIEEEIEQLDLEDNEVQTKQPEDVGEISFEDDEEK